MIVGNVNAELEAELSLGIRGPASSSFVSAVIDTGFSSFIALPSRLIEELRLPWRKRGRTTLAHGGEVVFDIYELEIEWDGVWRRVEVAEAEANPLLGMQMLAGFELRVQVEQHGAVLIAPLC